MSRITTIQLAEDIYSYDHQIGKCVRVVVATGAPGVGGFVFDVPFLMDIIEILGQDYATLMAAGPITLPALWTLVDLVRQRRAAAAAVSAPKLIP